MVLNGECIRGDVWKIGERLHVLMMFWGVAQVLKGGCLVSRRFLDVYFYNCKKRCHLLGDAFFCA